MSTPSIVVMNCGRAFSFASDLAPVVVRAPVAHQLLQLRELHALRLVGDGLPVGPSRGGDAPAQIDEIFLRNIDAEGANGIAAAAAPAASCHGRKLPALATAMPIPAAQKSAAITAGPCGRFHRIHSECPPTLNAAVEQQHCCRKAEPDGMFI